MADSLLALADIVKLNDLQVQDLGATDIFNDAPVLRALAADVASHGTTHKYLKESTAPTVGFRAANAGRDHSKSGDTVVEETLKILDASYHIDAMLAEGNARGLGYVLEREAMRHLRAAYKACERQFLYGTAEDAGGFNGLADNAGLNHTDDDMVYDAGASGGAGTELTDVWMFRSTGMLQDVAIIMGQSGDIQIGDPFEFFAEDGDGKKFPAWGQRIDGYIGLQVGGAKSVGRLANVQVKAGEANNRLTDDLLSELYALFPEELEPTHIAMNKRALKDLQQSRTATNATGAPAPWPTEWNGIPIIATSSIGTYSTAITTA